MRARLRRALTAVLQRQPHGRQVSLAVEIAQLAGIDHVMAHGRNGDILVPLADPVISRAYLHEGVWSPAMLDLLTSALARGGTLVDIGANIGLTTVPIAKLDGVRVIAFEPHPLNLRSLRASLAWNDLTDRVDVRDVALADASGSMSMEVAAANIGDHRLRPASSPPVEDLFGEGSRETITVTVERLDDVIDEGTLARPIVVKVDVQGAEALVLDGGRATLAAADLVVMELWPYGLRRMGCQPSTLLSTLAGLFTELALLPSTFDEPLRFHPSQPDGVALVTRALREHATEDAHVDVILRGSST